MKLSRLIDTLLLAQASLFDSDDNDPEVVLAFEPSTLEEGFDWKSTEGIADIRIASDWPLPGNSVMVYEGEKPSKVIIFYDNHFALESSKE